MSDINQNPSSDNMLTPKQIAQYYILNDIVVHELILAALDKVESFIERQCDNKKQLTKYDLVHRIITECLNDPLFETFGLRGQEIMKAIKTEYAVELDWLLSKMCKNCNL
jgi:hypothetical protein